MQLDQQIKYIQEKPRKACIYHNRQAISMCHKLTCTKHPFLCGSCAQQGIHMHKDKVSNFTEAIRDLCMEIIDYQKVANDMTMTKGKGDERDVLAAVEKLQKEILEAIRQTKEMLKAQIDGNIDKIKRNTNSAIKFYKNPNILAKKIISESSVDFITKLKRCLVDRKATNEGANQMSIYKTQMESLKLKLEGILHNSVNTLSRQPSKYQPDLRLQVGQRKIYSLPAIPQFIYNFKDNMLVCGDRCSYLFNLEQKAAIPLDHPFTLAASVPDPRAKCSFLALIPPTNIIYFSDGIRSQLQVREQPTALASFICGQVFVAVGYLDGDVEVLKIQTGEVVLKSKKHSQAVNCMRVLQNDNLLVVGGKDGRLSIYQYRQAGGIKIDFVNYAAVMMEGLMGFQVVKKDFVLFSDSGNIKVFDYTQGSPVLQSKIRDKAIVDAVAINQQKGFALLTLAKGQRDLKLWLVDREKGTIKIDKLPCSIKHPSLNHNSMFVWNQNLWIVKENAAQVHVCELEYVTV